MSMTRRRRGFLITLGTAFALTVSLLTAGVPQAHAADLASIVGTVTADDASGPSPTYPQVTLYQRSGTSWKFYDYTTGGKDGTYGFFNLPAGTYTLEFDAKHGENFVAEWWNGQSSEAAATPITLTSDGSATDDVTADASLATGGTISGTITLPPAGAVAFTPDPDIWLLEPDGQGGWQDTSLWTYPTQAGDTRTYSIVGVPAGTYAVYFGDDAALSDFTPLFYDQGTSGTPEDWQASPVVLAAGQVRTGVDATYVHGATVTGKVTDYAGNALAGVTATFTGEFDVNGQTEGQTWSAQTDSSGMFHATGLPPGTWHLEDTRSGYAKADYFGGASFVLAGGQPMTLPVMKMSKLLATGTPTVSGTLATGFTLTAKPGTWTSGTSFSYAWYANGVYISGSSGPTHAKFTLPSTVRDKQISVKVTGTKAGYASAWRLSAATLKVALTTAPTITGMPRVGSTLTAHAWIWTSGMTLSYQWYASGTAISGATHSWYTLTSAQRGKTITVKVTGKKTGYMTVTRVSPATPTVT